jgi:spore maturation protein CgeB
MRIAFFVHSLVSCWNHGNAHFLRGVVRELRALGYDVVVYEPEGAWSRRQLIEREGAEVEAQLARSFPTTTYGRRVDTLLNGVDAAVVHEWNEPELVAAVGRSGVTALFHDTHHRAVSAPDRMERYELDGYAGVLAFGRTIADVYRERSWHDRVWVWHEAADHERFRPLAARREGDLVWIGNWGDDERTRELDEFLFTPVRRLGLTGAVHGVRYPAPGLAAVERAGLEYRGWLPNHRAPEAFARHRVTVHVPRRPYATALPGIPTIRVFEALACGIPLVSAPWDDAEGLFRDGDFLWARDGHEMTEALRAVVSDRAFAGEVARRGLETVLARHTCAHRARELTAILTDERAEIAA